MWWNRLLSTAISAILILAVGIFGSVLNYSFKLNFSDLGSVFSITMASSIIIFNLKKNC